MERRHIKWLPLLLAIVFRLSIFFLGEVQRRTNSGDVGEEEFRYLAVMLIVPSEKW